MGADARAVRRIVMAQGMKLAGIGVVLGEAFGCRCGADDDVGALRGGDPRVRGITCLAVLGSAAAARYVPARSSARVDSMVTLRAP